MTATVIAASVLLVCLIGGTTATDTQMTALMSLYKSTNGAAWTNNAGWGSGNHFCSWYGVTCDVHLPIVYTLELPNNNLAGPLPSTITGLHSLKSLDLSNNSLSGPLPGNFPEFQTLRLLHIGNNQLSGPLPPQIWNLTQQFPAIQEVYLNDNQFTGAIPETLWGPATLPVFHPQDNLQVFNVRNNQLTGALPMRLTRCNNLLAILVNGNNMDSIPSDPSMTSFLQFRKYCDLTGNSWACPVDPAVVSNCRVSCK